MTIPCYPVQLHTGLQHPPATLPTACMKATSILFSQKFAFLTGEGDTKLLMACKHGSGNKCCPFLFLLRSFWEQHNGWQQPLKSHNLAPCKRQGQSTLQSLSNSDFFFSLLLQSSVTNASFTGVSHNLHKVTL